MLKALKPHTFAGVANAKCGEVYFQSLNSYRINCAFCDMKSFVFADFLLHIQNEHFENELLKTETETLQPKQEKLDGSSHLTPQVNSFSWYEVNNAADDSENEFITKTKPNNGEAEDQYEDEDDDFEDPVDVSSSVIAIMKWDNGREPVRHTRALRVDYNEESDMENTDSEKSKSLKVTKEQLVCTLCDKSYQCKKMLQRHMERQHKSVESVADFNDHEDVVVDVDADADYVPPKVHSSKPSSEYKCEHCDKVYQGKYTLRQHVKRDHDVNLTESFICLECNVQLPRLRLLDEHMVNVHGGAPCVICDRRYKTRHELKRHQLKHSNERNVECNYPGCEKRFFSTRHMRNHSKVHSEQRILFAKAVVTVVATRKRYASICGVTPGSVHLVAKCARNVSHRILDYESTWPCIRRNDRMFARFAVQPFHDKKDSIITSSFIRPPSSLCANCAAMPTHRQLVWLDTCASIAMMSSTFHIFNLIATNLMQLTVQNRIFQLLI